VPKTNVSSTSGSTRKASKGEESITLGESHNHTPGIETLSLDDTKLPLEAEEAIRKCFKTVFGPADGDILQIMDIRDRWLGSQDVTFPTGKITTEDHC
jgi:hypothetical protein